MPTPHTAMTIAGTDSSGGAGIHSDLRAFAAHRVHGATAVAALTAQSTRGVEAIHLVPPEFVAAQIDVVLGDLDVRAAKTGFLASEHTVAVVAERAAAGALRNLVVDPVMVSARGDRLFADEVTAAYLGRLVPTATVVTPNRIEAALLVDRDVRTVADMEAAASELRGLGPEVVVVKGGDADDEGDEAIDVVASSHGLERLVARRVDTDNDHGSGCSFSAAIAANLALGRDVADAVRRAKAFVHRGLTGAAHWQLGAGHGPIDAFGWGDPEA